MSDIKERLEKYRDKEWEGHNYRMVETNRVSYYSGTHSLIEMLVDSYNALNMMATAPDDVSIDYRGLSKHVIKSIDERLKDE